VGFRIREGIAARIRKQEERSKNHEDDSASEEVVSAEHKPQAGNSDA